MIIYQPLSLLYMNNKLDVYKRQVLQRPLTLAEKILYTHLFDEKGVKDYKRGEDYVNFRPCLLYTSRCV